MNPTARALIVALLVSSGFVQAQVEQQLYQTDWLGDLDPELGVQANVDDISVVADPTHRFASVLRATIRRAEDFSRIANGVPRAEVVFPAPVRFSQGRTYRVAWSTMLPHGTQFDARQFVIVTQINQGHWNGGPTIALALQGTRYAISQHGGMRHDTVSAGRWLCCADADVGRWVYWELSYLPKDDGEHALTELRRDGKLVFRATGMANAYPGVQDAYLKMGLYKPAWQTEPTDVADVTMLYGPVQIARQ